MTETGLLKLPPKKLLGILSLQYGKPWFLLALAGIAVFIALGCALDIRFLVLALIWVFLVIPLGVAFLYFFYAMDPLTVFNAIPHKIQFLEKQLVIVLPSEDPESESPEKRISVNREELRQIKSGADYVILFFGKKGWLWVPVAGFGNVASFKETIEGLVPYTQGAKPLSDISK